MISNKINQRQAWCCMLVAHKAVTVLKHLEVANNLFILPEIDPRAIRTRKISAEFRYQITDNLSDAQLNAVSSPNPRTREIPN